MRDDDKRPPLRRAVHAKSQRQTHIQKRVRKDTRGMRGKARRADKDDEIRNRGDEKGNECLNERRADHAVSPQNLRCSRQRKTFTQ